MQLVSKLNSNVSDPNSNAFQHSNNYQGQVYSSTVLEVKLSHSPPFKKILLTTSVSYVCCLVSRRSVFVRINNNQLIVLGIVQVHRELCWNPRSNGPYRLSLHLRNGLRQLNKSSISNWWLLDHWNRLCLYLESYPIFLRSISFRNPFGTPNSVAFSCVVRRITDNFFWVIARYWT